MGNKGSLIAELMTLRKENEQLKHELNYERASHRVTCTLGHAYDAARTELAAWRDQATNLLQATKPSPLGEFGLRMVIYTLDDEITRLSQAEGDADLDVVMKSIAGECGIRIIDETG